MKIDLTRGEAHLVYNQLNSRCIYFQELMKKETLNGNVDRVLELNNAVKKLNSIMTKLLV